MHKGKRVPFSSNVSACYAGLYQYCPVNGEVEEIDLWGISHEKKAGEWGERNTEKSVWGGVCQPIPMYHFLSIWHSEMDLINCRQFCSCSGPDSFHVHMGRLENPSHWMTPPLYGHEHRCWQLQGSCVCNKKRSNLFWVNVLYVLVYTSGSQSMGQAPL